MKLQFGTLLNEDDVQSQNVLHAITTALDRYEHAATTSIHMPPRYGKSSVLRLIALNLRAATGMPGVMCAPWEDNVVQIKDPEKIAKMYETYGVTGVEFTSHRCEALKTHEWWHLASGVPTMITATIGLIHANERAFLDGIADMRSRFRKRVPVLVDECHNVKDRQQWGTLVRKIIDAGGYMVLVTGTAVPGIPGFKDEFKEWEETEYRVLRKELTGGEVKWFSDKREGRTHDLKAIHADVEVKWRDAWDVGALARCDGVWIDIDVIDDETKELLGPLSTIDQSELSGRLKGIMESEKMMSRMATAALDRLFFLRSRKGAAAAQMLVMTGHDVRVDGTANKHAEGYKQIFQTFLKQRGQGDLIIEIATGTDVNGEPDKKAAKKIKQFRQGKIDILIVKAMGLVGLDCPPCKVLLFGSTLRNNPLAIQGLSRPLTPWNGCRAKIIMAADEKMKALYDRVIHDQGGDYRENDTEVTETIEVEPPDEKVSWIYDNARVGAYSDEEGQLREGDYEERLSFIRSEYPAFADVSDRVIIDGISQSAFSFANMNEWKSKSERPKAAGIRDLDEDLPTLTGKFGKKAQDIVSKYINYYETPDRWREAVTNLQAKAKILCGVKQPVPSVDDADLLRTLIEALDTAEREMFGDGQARRAI